MPEHFFVCLPGPKDLNFVKDNQGSVNLYTCIWNIVIQTTTDTDKNRYTHIRTEKKIPMKTDALLNRL